jgi:CHAT domain-containing protein
MKTDKKLNIMKYRILFLILSLFSNIISFGQEELDINSLLTEFNKGMSYWGESPTDYYNANKALSNYEKSINSIYQTNPLLGTDFVKSIDNIFTSPNRRFIRFMFNCNSNNPSFAKSINSKSRAWNMLQRQKSFYSRFFTVTGLYLKLSEEDKQKANNLFIALDKINDPIEIVNQNNLINEVIDGYSLYSQNITSINQLQEKLNTNDVYLSFLFTDNARAVYIWEIKKNEEKVYKLKINSAELFIRIEMIKAHMEDDNKYFNYLKTVLTNEKNRYSRDRRATSFLNDGYTLTASINALSRELISPLNINNSSNIIIEVDQNISNLPFDILRNIKGKELYKFHTITYTTSANIFYKHTDKPIVTELKYIGFGNSNKGELEIANDEIENSATIFNKKSVNINSSETNIYNKLNNDRYDIVHFSSHSSINMLATKMSYTDENLKVIKFTKIEREIGLLFGKDLENDGYMQPKEIFLNIKKRNNQPLLLLSSCEIAPSLNIKRFLGLEIILSKDIKNAFIEKSNIPKDPLMGGCVCSFSESSSGLISSFSGVGFRDIIATQWKVDAVFANHFANVFFEYYKKLQSPSIALKKTKEHFSDKPSEKRAAFIYIKT